MLCDEGRSALCSSWIHVAVVIAFEKGIKNTHLKCQSVYWVGCLAFYCYYWFPNVSPIVEENASRIRTNSAVNRIVVECYTKCRGERGEGEKRRYENVVLRL